MKFFQELKKNGYIVSLVPPQSYFDFQTSEYSHNIYLPPADPWHQEFTYTGRNVYAYWLAKFGTVEVNDAVRITSKEANDDEIEEWEIVNRSSDNIITGDEFDVPLCKLIFGIL